MSSERRSLRLRTKLSAVLLLVSLIPLAVVLVVYEVQVRKTEVAQVHDRIESVAAVQRTRLQELYDDFLQEFARTASQPRLVSLFRDFLRTGDEAVRADIQILLEEIREASPEISLIRLAGTDGVVVASTDPEGSVLLNPDGLMPELPGVGFQNRGEVFEADVIGSFPQRGPPLGKLEVTTSASDLEDVVTDFAGLGETGETVVAVRTQSGDARIVLPPRFADVPGAREIIPEDETEVSLTRAMAGDEVLLTDIVDYRGEPVISATRYIPGADWGMVVEIDAEEALAPFNRTRRTLLGIAAAMALFIAGISLALARYMTRPVDELATVAGRIAAGDLDVRAPSQRRDEFGLLATVFNQMTDRLISMTESVQQRVTELGRANAALAAAEEKLQAEAEALATSNKDLQQFAYAASHDLQAPLRTVAGFTAKLRGDLETSGWAGDEATEHDLARIEHGTRRMRELILDLLAYSRVEGKAGAIVVTDARPVLDDVLLDLETQIADAGAAVSVDPLPSVLADPGQLGQLFQNLVDNSLKYRSTDRGAELHVRAERDGELIRFEFRDNGIGIDPRYFERIFELFQRLHASDMYSGTGVGLALCRKIVQRHGGRIWVESTPGEGSMFMFTLPAAEKPRESST